MAIAKAEILESIANMTVLELSQLIKEMEEKFGVSAAAASCCGGCARCRRRRCRGGGANEFTVMLTAVGESKVNVIKVVRADYRAGPERSERFGGRRAQSRSRKVFPKRMLKPSRNNWPKPVRPAEIK